MRILIPLFTFVVLILPCAAARGDDAPVDAWQPLEAIAAAHPSPDTYRARFTQKKRSPLLRDPIVSAGTVRMAGGLARWDTDAPHATVMLLGRGQLQLYYPDQNTLEVYDLGDRLDAIATSPVPDLARLRQHFSLESSAWSPNHAALKLTLAPRDDALRDAIDTIDVHVNAATGSLHRLVLTDPDGETTELTFTDPEFDPPLDPADLELAVPVNTRVVHPLDAGPTP